MHSHQIHFFEEDIEFELNNPKLTSDWIAEVVHSENQALTALNYIFCSDDHLLQINRKFLSHDFYTDILTFDQSDQPGLLEADIYISVERVRDNAVKNSRPFNEELSRVMIHGVLHLLGYKDKTDKQKEQMRKKEEACLSLQKF